MFIKLMSVFICALAIIYFLGKDSINFEDISLSNHHNRSCADLYSD